MKKTFYKTMNRVCGVFITLLGFTAPITLASCYGPMPADHRVTADELTDSANINEADSLIASSDSTQLVEDSTLLSATENIK